MSQLKKQIAIEQEILQSSERPKQLKSVSAETEISAKLTETSAEISAEIWQKNYVKLRLNLRDILFHSFELVFSKWNSNVGRQFD